MKGRGRSEKKTNQLELAQPRSGGNFEAVILGQQRATLTVVCAWRVVLDAGNGKQDESDHGVKGKFNMLQIQTNNGLGVQTFNHASLAQSLPRQQHPNDAPDGAAWASILIFITSPVTHFNVRPTTEARSSCQPRLFRLHACVLTLLSFACPLVLACLLAMRPSVGNHSARQLYFWSRLCQLCRVG